VLGPETLTALESRLEIQVSKRAVSLECSRASLELVVRFEVGSRQRYEREFQRPTGPGGMSGVTIGIGYDLGMTPKSQITSDWESYLFEHELAALLAVQGVTGPAAKQLALGVSHVKIPLKSAEEVFYLKTLPHFAARTRAAFAGDLRARLLADLPVVAPVPSPSLGLIAWAGFIRGPEPARSAGRIAGMAKSVDAADLGERVPAGKPAGA